MYAPAHFDASDLGFCHDLIRAYPFATVTTTSSAGELFASHLPFLLDDGRGPFGTLIAHVARANPQGDALAAGASALVVFTGPHAYISPTWYETSPAVPTWNYCAVHAYGTARMLGEDATHLYLARLAETFEPAGDHAWRADALPPDYRTKMVRGVVAFELEIDQLQGKAKLSQNRSGQDVSSVIAALESSNADLTHWMQRLRQRSS